MTDARILEERLRELTKRVEENKEAYEKAHQTLVDKNEQLLVAVAENRGRDRMVSVTIGLAASFFTSLVIFTLYHFWR